MREDGQDMAGTGPEPPGWERLFEEGVALTDSGRPAMAVVVFQRILRLAPAHPEVLGALGDAYRKLGALGPARATCEQALAIAPDHAFARLVLARTLYEAGDLNGAETAYWILAEQLPGNMDILNELVTILMIQDRYPETLALVRQRLREAPGNGHLHFVKGFIHHHLLALEEAVACYDRGLATDPAPALRDRLRWNRGLVRLLLGQMDEEAWAARELRGPMAGTVPRTFPRPEWDGGPLEGRTLLLHGTDEGLGDCIMGLHYVAPIKGRGGRVLVEARPELVELVRTCPGVDEVVGVGEPLPPFDCHAHLMSLPRLFQTRLDTIPWTGPYLSVPPPARISHSEELERLTARVPGRLNLGLVYAGITNEATVAQALDPALLGRLASLKGRVRFFSLQKHRTPPLAGLPASLEATDLGGLLADFSASAWALSRMDLLVSVDTSMLHLAGAMGVPAAGLLPFLPDWRWLAEGDRSPWYPSLRLYRQRARHDWATVLEALVRDLGTFDVQEP